MNDGQSPKKTAFTDTISSAPVSLILEMSGNSMHRLLAQDTSDWDICQLIYYFTVQFSGGSLTVQR
jgi:hypothetical protein